MCTFKTTSFVEVSHCLPSSPKHGGLTKWIVMEIPPICHVKTQFTVEVYKK